VIKSAIHKTATSTTNNAILELAVQENIPQGQYVKVAVTLVKNALHYQSVHLVLSRFQQVNFYYLKILLVLRNQLAIQGIPRLEYFV
jgi:hypothetical protein